MGVIKYVYVCKKEIRCFFDFAPCRGDVLETASICFIVRLILFLKIQRHSDI